MTETSSMIRVGIVSAVNKPTGQARVYFPAQDNLVSDWLYVMRYPKMSVTVQESDGHAHDASIADWFPSVNDKVVVLYAYGMNSDGFILGVIQ